MDVLACAGAGCAGDRFDVCEYSLRQHVRVLDSGRRLRYSGDRLHRQDGLKCSVTCRQLGRWLTVAADRHRNRWRHYRRPAKWGLAVSLRGSNPGTPMSALGQKRTLKRLHPMSALPPKADMVQHDCDVRFVPKADICGAANCNLFDHFVGRGEQRRRNSHAKGLCTFEIEREYKFSWLLDRKISRIRTLQNSINVIGGALTQRE